jgi:hypothetical protein
MFVATLVVGIGAVAAISAAPFYVSRLPLRHAPGLGTTLVLAAVGLSCLAASGDAPLRGGLALCAFPTLVAGTLLLLARNGGDDRDGGDGGDRDDNGDPPWWPEFDAAFRSYSRRPRLPVSPH